MFSERIVEYATANMLCGFNGDPKLNDDELTRDENTGEHVHPLGIEYSAETIYEFVKCECRMYQESAKIGDTIVTYSLQPTGKKCNEYVSKYLIIENNI